MSTLWSTGLTGAGVPSGRDDCRDTLDCWRLGTEPSPRGDDPVFECGAGVRLFLVATERTGPIPEGPPAEVAVLATPPDEVMGVPTFFLRLAMRLSSTTHGRASTLHRWQDLSVGRGVEEEGTSRSGSSHLVLRTLQRSQDLRA